MKLLIDGNIDINEYYVQTLCMVFFPGVKFSEDGDNDDGKVLTLSVNIVGSEVHAHAKIEYDGKICESSKTMNYDAEAKDCSKTLKKAIGSAVVTACGELLGYKPSWGMLTGVRPSKVATDMLLCGMSKTKVKQTLVSDYLVTPKKAALATQVALNERRIIGVPDKHDCSLYISIPFCPTRCAYCSFVSYTSKKLLSLIPDYLEKLLLDIENNVKEIRKFRLNIKTIYIGGGTPTILDAQSLEKLLSKINELIDVSTLEEFTLESGRPDTITEEKFRIAAKYGVTRVSVNPQSLCQDVLENIGRAHTVEDFFRAYDIAASSGIKYINTDLIVGLPGDNFKKFASTFDQILKLRPANITVHTFCVKKSADILKSGTNVYSLRGGDAGKCVDYSQIKSLQAGYVPYYMYRQKNTVGNYENVGFALEGTEGLYNIYMMEEVHSIFASGAGGVTKLVDYFPQNGGNPHIERVFNPKYPYEYLNTDNAGDRVAEHNAEIERFYSDIM